MEEKQARVELEELVHLADRVVGLSLGLVSALAALLSVLCLASAIGPYRRLVAATEGRA